MAAAFTVINHTELSGSAASVSIASIPSSYDHLLLKVSARSDQSAHRDTLNCTVNGDTGTNYSRTHLFTGTSSPSSYRNSGGNKWHDFMELIGASAQAGTFSVGTLWLPNYAGTTGYKQGFASSATTQNSNTDYQWGLQNVALLWSSTAAINQLTFDQQTGPNFVQYSTFTLYGVTA
jgi:hypothetical protein